MRLFVRAEDRRPGIIEKARKSQVIRAPSLSRRFVIRFTFAALREIGRGEGPRFVTREALRSVRARARALSVASTNNLRKYFVPRVFVIPARGHASILSEPSSDGSFASRRVMDVFIGRATSLSRLSRRILARFVLLRRRRAAEQIDRSKSRSCVLHEHSL